MRPLVVQDVAQLRCLNMTSQALEELVRSARLRVDNEELSEAEVLRVASISIALSLLNRFLNQFRDRFLTSHVLVAIFAA